MDDIKSGAVVICNGVSDTSRLVVGGIYTISAVSRYYIKINDSWYNFNDFKLLEEYRVRIVNEILE